MCSLGVPRASSDGAACHHSRSTVHRRHNGVLQLDYAYVCATDFARAVAWYRDVLFRAEPSLETDRFAYFTIGGASFGVFDPQ